MLPTMILQWFRRGVWQEIGWRAGTPKSQDDLRAHGQRMASKGGHYRLAYLPATVPGEVTVVHEFPARVLTGL